MQELPLSLRDRPLVVRTSTDRCERQVEPGGIVIRPAVSQEQDEIVTFVRSERMNPFDLDWRRFLLATDRSGIVATVQLRHHGDGSRELGSLVVRKDARRRNVASRLIGTLLASAPARVFMITGSMFGPTIPNQVAKTLVAVIDWKLDPQAAVTLPNFGSRNGPTELEADTAVSALAGKLEALGHGVRILDQTSGSQAIVRAPHGWIGGADPRREGVVRGD